MGLNNKTTKVMKIKRAQGTLEITRNGETLEEVKQLGKHTNIRRELRKGNKNSDRDHKASLLWKHMLLVTNGINMQLKIKKDNENHRIDSVATWIRNLNIESCCRHQTFQKF